MHVGNYGCFVLETCKCRKVRKVHPSPLTEKALKIFLKKRVKSVKISPFFGQTQLFFADFFLSWTGGNIPPPLNGKSFCPKNLAEWGVPPPHSGKNPGVKYCLADFSRPRGTSLFFALDNAHNFEVTHSYGKSTTLTMEIFHPRGMKIVSFQPKNPLDSIWPSPQNNLRVLIILQELKLKVSTYSWRKTW